MTDDKDEFEKWLVEQANFDRNPTDRQIGYDFALEMYQELKEKLKSQIISDYNKELTSDAAVEAAIKPRPLKGVMLKDIEKVRMREAIKAAIKSTEKKMEGKHD